MRNSILAALAFTLLPAAAMAAGGTVTGKVDATPAKYLADTVVYLKEVPGTWPKKNVSMDQKGMVFIPHLLLITVGDTVDFLNSDTVAHNIFTADKPAYNLGTFKPGEKASHLFDKAGTYSQLCSIHPEMLAYVFVGQNPFSAVVDATGAFKIENVPPGTYKIDLWNAKLNAPEQSVTVTDGKSATANFSMKR